MLRDLFGIPITGTANITKPVELNVSLVYETLDENLKTTEKSVSLGKRFDNTFGTLSAEIKSKNGAYVWRYMGVFENAPETERLHFHALMYIPDGEMIGSIYEKNDYNKKSGKMTITRINTFFEDVFGRNDFRPVNEKEITHGNTINYLLKYLSKSGEKIVYSRGIPSEVCIKIKDRDIAGEMFDYVEKVVLFDDVISWERDILNYKSKQLTMRELFMSA